MMNLKPLKAKKDYEAALAGVYGLMQKNLKANCEQPDELEVLSIIVYSLIENTLFLGKNRVFSFQGQSPTTK
ncbi:MAG: hypothetical protein ACXWWC_07715 [Chitinophagaceae bacterium]